MMENLNITQKLGYEMLVHALNTFMIVELKDMPMLWQEVRYFKERACYKINGLTHLKKCVRFHRKCGNEAMYLCG